MPKQENNDQFTPEQIEELSGEYKHTDNPTPENFFEEVRNAVKRRSSSKKHDRQDTND